MHRLLAIVSALSLTALLLSALFGLQQSEIAQPQKTIIREVALAVKPPPPPPPPAVMQQSQQAADSSINLTAAGAGPPIQFTKVELTGKAEIIDLQPPPINNLSSRFAENLNVDWQAFGLDELDDVPRLLTSSSQFRIKYPSSLVRRGIRRVELELDVVIDENGNVILRGFVHNIYPELEPLVQQLMHKARFTAPKKDGMPVRAAFTWPLEFENS